MAGIKMVTCVRDYNMYGKFIKNNPMCRSFELLDICNLKDNRPIPLRYNSVIDGIGGNSDDWLIFCHEDFELLEDITPLVARLDKDCLYGAVGCRRIGLFGFGMQLTLGNIVERNRDGSGGAWRVAKQIKKPEEVETFDCCCIIMHSSLVMKYGLRFDEQLEFDMYVEDFCANAKTKHGVRSFVVPIECCHHSGSRATDRLYRHLPYLREKYPNNNFVGPLTYFGNLNWQKRLQDRVMAYVRKWLSRRR